MAFPAHEPTGRSFDAGDYRYKTFSSQSGKEIRILYGDKRTGMKLQLQYANIADTAADDFITHYDEVKGGFDVFTLPSEFRAGWNGDADADHGAAAVAITERSDQGSDQELRQGIASRQQSQGSSVWGELGQEKGQQRKNNAFAEPVVEQREKRAEQCGNPRTLQACCHAGETHIPTGGCHGFASDHSGGSTALARDLCRCDRIAGSPSLFR